MAGAVLGIDLGATRVKSALVSRDRELLGKDERDTEADRGPEAVLDTMAASAKAAAKAGGVAFDSVAAVGVGAPGPMDWRTGVVFSPPNLPGWKDVPLAQSMQERLDVPCYVDNDANQAC